jgi:ABC-type phosphate transport system substrate-binding protein
MRSFLVMVGAACVVAAAMPATAPGYVVIVNADNHAAVIERELLSSIFLKRTRTWQDGTTAEPVDLSSKQIARVRFTRAVHGRSVGAVRAFWQQQIFSGRDVPPPELASDKEVMEFVKQHAGAVGYMSPTTPLGAGVKSIQVEGELP